MLPSFGKGAAAATDELSATLRISPDQRKHKVSIACVSIACVSKAPQHQLCAALPPCPQANMMVEPDV